MQKKNSSPFISNFFMSLLVCSIVLAIMFSMKFYINLGQGVFFALLGSICYAVANTNFPKRRKKN